MPRIHIFGASGSGTTTLGRCLSHELGISHIDGDEIYWKASDPPYQSKNSVEERHQQLRTRACIHEDWVVSGSMVNWCSPIKALIQLAVYLYVPADIRIDRLKRREREELGDRILPGGDRHQEHLEFLEWAEQYDEGRMSGRNRVRHREFIDTLSCPVLELLGEMERDEALGRVMGALRERDMVKESR